MWNAIYIVLHIGRQYSIQRIAVPRPHNAGVEGSSPALSISRIPDGKLLQRWA